MRDLFYAVPARLKFLRGERAETLEAADVIRRLAMAHPRVGFRFINDDRVMLDLPAQVDLRQRLADAYIGLKLMQWNALRSMGSGVPGPEASISKLFWGTWHRDLGELAMDIGGIESQIAEGFPYELTLDQKMFLFTRSETIYGGSNEIQRNVLGERVLGLPKEPNPS